ncbi:helix-turn-helix domain-containing protein [Streptomyces sp. NPDC048565]|uniref:MmyB family transcriptional regulator n=1 Tax=Streptomyces sp. NPDC048565 TaxID=3155266 RepID=UPI0034200AFE
MTTSKMGEYLRSRRAEVLPRDVGLPEDGRRRVPGLRREEVALLARISVDYYLRLEQGRERRPSTQVLDALSDALLLDDDGRLHLFRIAGMTPLPRHEGSNERADPQLLALAEMWDRTPVLLLGRAYDVLAANTLSQAVFPHLRPGANLLLGMFLDPSARSFYADWEKDAANAVAGFRFLEGARPNDPRIHEVLRAASEGSREFADLWQRRDARGKSDAAKVLLHPDVGELTLRMQTFDVRSAPGQQLIVYHAQEGTRTADALRLLGSLAATARPGQRDDDASRTSGDGSVGAPGRHQR